MLLYANGDSHTAAAEAVNTFAFAEDDTQYFYMGRIPHPDNAAVAWPRLLGETLKCGVFNNAESASSNQRIIRTTKQWLDAHADKITDVFVIIQWSTWEREEWLHDNTYYQVNASGIDHVPDGLKEKYKTYVSTVDWKQKTLQAHQDIWDFHKELEAGGFRHIFFNGNNHFGKLPDNLRQDWGKSYLAPYDPKMTFNQWLLDNKINTVSPNSYHFGKEAHAAWARFMLQYVVKNQLI